MSTNKKSRAVFKNFVISWPPSFEQAEQLDRLLDELVRRTNEALTRAELLAAQAVGLVAFVGNFLKNADGTPISNADGTKITVPA